MVRVSKAEPSAHTGCLDPPRRRPPQRVTPGERGFAKEFIFGFYVARCFMDLLHTVR